MNKDVILGLLVPFLGTSLGSAMVFVMRDELNEKVQKGLSGFAAGVMVAASIWSLLIPSMDMVDEKNGQYELGACSYRVSNRYFIFTIIR